MDIGSSFSYVFQDPQWIKKVAIGGGILLVGILFSWLVAIPILAAAALLLGYTLTVTKNVAEGSSVPLPEWNDFGALFMKGLYGLIGIIILYIPVIILACLSAAVTIGASSLTTGSSSSNTNTQILTVIGLLSTCIGCLQAIISLVTGLFMYAPLTRFALNGKLSTFWDFRGGWAFIQADLGNYVIAVLVSFVAGFIGALGIILCFIGLPFTAFWANLVSAHLFGQYARGKASAQMMSPSPLAPA